MYKSQFWKWTRMTGLVLQGHIRAPLSITSRCNAVSDLFVGERSYAARLVFEAGLAPLLHVSHVPQVPRPARAGPRCPPISRVSGHRQRVHLLRLREGAGVCRAFWGPTALTDMSQLPVTITLTSGQKLHAADGSVVRPHDRVWGRDAVRHQCVYTTSLWW